MSAFSTAGFPSIIIKKDRSRGTGVKQGRLVFLKCKNAEKRKALMCVGGGVGEKGMNCGCRKTID